MLVGLIALAAIALHLGLLSTNASTRLSRWAMLPALMLLGALIGYGMIRTYTSNTPPTVFEGALGAIAIALLVYFILRIVRR